MTDHTTRRLALLGTLIGAFETLHPAADQLAQSSRDATGKGSYAVAV